MTCTDLILQCINSTYSYVENVSISFGICRSYPYPYLCPIPPSPTPLSLASISSLSSPYSNILYMKCPMWRFRFGHRRGTTVPWNWKTKQNGDIIIFRHTRLIFLLVHWQKWVKFYFFHKIYRTSVFNVSMTWEKWYRIMLFPYIVLYIFLWI